MSGRRELYRRKELFATLDKILAALKALAYVEIQKLHRQIGPQHAITGRMRRAVSRLQKLAGSGRETPARLIVVLGTERGFCGDINRRLLEFLNSAFETRDPVCVLVGDRLHQAAGDRPGVLARISGPSVSEDVEVVVERLVTVLLEHSDRYAPDGVQILYYRESERQPVVISLFAQEPVLPSAGPEREFLLYRPAAELLRELLPMYLLAALQSWLKEALLGENRQRMSHLESATRHLEERLEVLERQANMQRQAEIIADIEALLFLTDSVK